MATRPELVEMCKDLDIDWDELSFEQMKKAVRKAAKRKFGSKKVHFSASKLSEQLRKFLTLESDFIILDKEGNRLDYKGNIIRRKV
jgi:hypothetical protein